MIEQTGCAGVSIGRGAFYNPWIFQQTQHYLKDRRVLPEPAFEERVRVMCRHLDLMIEVFGEVHGCSDVSQGRPVVCQAVRSSQRVQQAGGAHLQPAPILRFLAHYSRWREHNSWNGAGELKPRFRPAATWLPAYMSMPTR